MPGSRARGGTRIGDLAALQEPVRALLQAEMCKQRASCFCCQRLRKFLFECVMAGCPAFTISANVRVLLLLP